MFFIDTLLRHWTRQAYISMRKIRPVNLDPLLLKGGLQLGPTSSIIYAVYDEKDVRKIAVYIEGLKRLRKHLSKGKQKRPF